LFQATQPEKGLQGHTRGGCTLERKASRSLIREVFWEGREVVRGIKIKNVCPKELGGEKKTHGKGGKSGERFAKNGEKSIPEPAATQPYEGGGPRGGIWGR